MVKTPDQSTEEEHLIGGDVQTIWEQKVAGAERGAVRGSEGGAAGRQCGMG